jgi:hypothetical protein
MWHVFRVGGILLALSVAARAEQPVGPPDVRIGDRWTFQQRDGLTDDLQGEFVRRVVAVSPAEITAVMQVKGRAGQVIHYFSHDWNIIDNGVTKFDPSAVVLRFPLKIGDVWRGQYKTRTLANGFTTACRVSAKVAARETVKVPAGGFDALRVDGVVECHGVDGNAMSIQTASSNWYAPAVKAIVKTVYSGMYEGRERNRTVTEMLAYTLADTAEPAPGQPPAGTPSGQSSAAPSDENKGGI